MRPLTVNAPTLSIIVVIAFGYIAFYLAALIATGVTEWTISEKNIHLKWLSHDIFSRKPDKNFSWSDIEQYKYEPDPNGDLFRITLKDGDIINIRHRAITDDFQKLVAFFENTVVAYNHAAGEQDTQIKRAKTMYETNIGLIMIIFVALVLVAATIKIVVAPEAGKTNWIKFAVVYISGLSYISYIVSYRKKKAQG